MTYLQKFHQECPGYKGDIVDSSCPWRCGYEDTNKCPCYESGHTLTCDDCWNREVIQSDYWILVDGDTGVCPNCHRQDHIDPLAKYCRYCGARVELEE